MTEIKLCGLSRKQDIEVVNTLKPDYIGFVFYEKSKRYVNKEKAHALKALLDPDIKAVGVFLDHPLEMILELFNENIIDIAQLHGHESDDFVRDLQAKSNKPVMKAFKINEQYDFNLVNQSSADMILLDSGIGSGKVFDWQLISKVNRLYFLAGGIGLDNVKEALQHLHPYGIDVSSGIETDGLKDARKMKSLVEVIREEDEK